MGRLLHPCKEFLSPAPLSLPRTEVKTGNLAEVLDPALLARQRTHVVHRARANDGRLQTAGDRLRRVAHGFAHPTIVASLDGTATGGTYGAGTRSDCQAMMAQRSLVSSA